MGETTSSPLPPGLDLIQFDGYAGLNTNASRVGIEDSQMYICDGFMPVGKSWSRTMYGIGTAVWNSASGGLAGVSFFQSFNIGYTQYLAIFLTDGSIWVANTSNSTTTMIAAAGTITYPSTGNVGVTQWNSTYLLIVANQTNGYFAWDGTTFYATGATVPGIGVMPAGIQGTGITTYLGRVWIIYGNLLTFSAAASFVDFATSDGGGVTPSNDSTLRVQYVGIVSTNGFLYLIGDSSVSYVSNVTSSVSGGTTTTTFTVQNADPQTGTPYSSSLTLIGQDVAFSNAYGVHVSYGGRVTKISDDLDGIYSTVPNFGGVSPSAGTAVLFGKRVLVVLALIIDQVTLQPVYKLLLWDRKKWWTSNQDIPLTFIGTSELDSVLTCYGTDGNQIVPLFQKPSANFSKTMQSKLFARPHYALGKAASRLFGVVQYYSFASTNISMSIDNETGSSTPIVVGPDTLTWDITWTGLSWFLINTTSGVLVIDPVAIGQAGALIGMTVTTNASDAAILSLAVVTKPVQYRG